MSRYWRIFPTGLPSGYVDLSDSPDLGARKKEKTAMSYFWDTHHTNKNVKKTPM